MEINETIKAYITRARNIASRSASLGKTISTREIVYHVARGISYKLEKVGSVLRAQKGLSLEEVEQILSEEETRQTKDGDIKYYTNKGKDEKAYKMTGNYKKKNSSGCFVCGRTNHVAKQCYYRQDKSNNHSKGRNQRGKIASGGRGDGYRKHSNTATKDRNEYSYCAYRNKAEEDEKYKWTLYSTGSTSHMTPNKEIISEIKPYYTKIHLAEEERAIQTEAKGTIKVKTFTREGNKNICIKDVLYVPSLPTNLLSVSRLIECGNKVIFSDYGAKIVTQKNEIIGEAKEQDGIFIVCTTPRDEDCKNTMEEKKNQRSRKNPDEAVRYRHNEKLLWHKRLGHISEEYMDTMQCQNIVKDFNFTKERLKICEACVMGKISQRPHKQLEERATKVPLELIHIDVCGPLPTKSQGGNRYILVIVDDYSRYICTYFMQNKTDVYKYFVEYVNRYENDLNRKLKKVRSDNGTEFTNKEFENYLNHRGIKRERTVAYNPQSNGVVERSNRILLDKARTLLIDAQLPMKFWAEAVATATYLRTVSLAKGGNNKTPIEMWSSKKPTVSYLKIFGCLTYYYLPKVQRNKLQPKARKGIFIGYSQETRGYKIYDPEYRKIYAVRTAKFNENL